MAKAKDLLAARQAKFENTPNTSKPNDSLNIYSGPILNLDSSFIDYTSNIQDSPDQAIQQSPFSNDFFNTKLLGIDLGEVTTEPYNRRDVIDPFNPKIDFQKIRADRQSAISKVGAGTANFLGDTAIGIVGNIVGGFYGLGSAIAQGDAGNIFDNSVYRNLDEAKESWEAKNTLFVNEKDGFGFNAKTGKELADAFSFIASAVASEAIMQSAGNIVGGAGLLSAAGRGGRYMKQLGKLFSAADKFQDYERMGMQLGKSVEEMSAIRNTIEKLKATTELGRKILTTTSYEAGLEARGAKDEFLAGMQDKLEYYLENNTSMTDAEKDTYREEYTNKINTEAEKVGMATFLANTALLSVSNAAQFPTIFGSSYMKRSMTGGIKRKGINEVIKKKGLLTGVSRILKNPTVEFFEETGQGLAGQTSQNYFEVMLGDQTQAGALSSTAHNFGASLWKGLEDTYGTSEGLHEGLIGAVVGAIGIPGFKKRSGKGYKIQMQGGIAESVRDLRKEREFAESTINQLNSQKLSDVLKYNKDNAIRAAVDAKREDYATLKEDPIELEDVDNNKVFRYTIDRMAKGAEEFIEGDIQDLQNMDLDKYKATFDKGEDFSQEEKDAEINRFKEKTDIYKQAYKAVNKRFVNRLLQSDPVHSKLSDVLTYAVASEKIYSNRLKDIKRRILDLNNIEFTPEEIDFFIKTAGKLDQAQEALDSYITIQTRNEGKVKRNKLKEQLDSKYQYLLDLESDVLQSQLEDIQQEELDSNPEVVKNIKKAQKLKEEYDKQIDFDTDSTPEAKKYQKDLNKSLDDMNKALENYKSKSMKTISGNKIEKLTKSEIDKYIETKKRINKELNKQSQNNDILDLIEIDSENQVDLIRELEKISNKYTTAAEVASYLYGFKDTPYSAYGKIKIAELEANIENALTQKTFLEFKMGIGQFNSEEDSLALDELEASTELLKNGFEEIKPGLNNKAITEVQKIINELDSFLETYKKVTVQKEEKKKAKEKAAKTETEESAQSSLDDMIKNSGIVSQEEKDNPADTEETATQPRASIAYKKKTNRLSIRQAEDLSSVNPKMQEFAQLVEEGKIKKNSAVVLGVVENEIDLENNEYLKNKLKNAKLYDKYIAGLNKVKADPSILNNKDFSDFDEDVYTFIRFAPIGMSIIDKQVEDNNFEINPEDESIYEQYLFEAEDLTNIDEAELEQKFQEGKTKIELERDKKLDNTTSDTDKQFIINNAKNEIEKLKSSLEASKNSQFSNFDYRRNTLKQNFLNNSNLFKLKVFNVDNGNFESSEFGKKEIQERNIEELISKEIIDENTFFYTDQNRKYRSLSGEQIRPGHPLYGKLSKDSGKFFLLYEDIAGRKIPVKLNTRLLQQDLAQTIYNALEEYFSASDPEQVKISNSGIKHIDDKNLEVKEFINKFIRLKANNVNNPILLKDAFGLNSNGFTLFVGEQQGINIKNLDDLKENKNLLLSKLANVRFFPHKDHLINEDKTLNKKGLDYLVDNKILNHHFDIENNFDKIYEPNYRKGIVLSKVNTAEEIQQTDKQISKSYGSKLKSLSNLFNSKYSRDKGFEANTKSVYLSIRNSIMRSLRTLQNSDNYSNMSDMDILNKAIENVFNTKISAIEKVMEEHPDKAGEEMPLKELLNLVNEIKENSFTRKTSKANLLSENKLWGSKTFLTNVFKDPLISLSLNNYSDKTAVNVDFAPNEEQFNDLMIMINRLKQLVDDSYTGYVDIKYTDAYRYKDKKGKIRVINSKGTYQYTDLSGVSSDMIEAKHVRSRLRGVNITGNPQYDSKSGKIIGGSVVFQVETRNKDGEYNQMPLLVVPNQDEVLPNYNVMTSLYLPFMNKNRTLNDEELQEAFKDVKTRENIRLKGTSMDLKKVENKTIDETVQTPSKQAGETGVGLIGRAIAKAQGNKESTKPVPANEQPESNENNKIVDEDQPQELSIEEQLKANNLIAPEPKKEFNTLRFQKGAVRKNIVSSIKRFVEMPKAKTVTRKNIKRQNINNADELYQVLSIYETKYNEVFSEDIKTIAENLFDQKIKDCNG